MTVKIDSEMLELVRESKENAFSTELLLLGGHKQEGKITEIKGNMVYMNLKTSQPYTSGTHISKVVGVNNREK